MPQKVAVVKKKAAASPPKKTTDLRRKKPAGTPPDGPPPSEILALRIIGITELPLFLGLAKSTVHVKGTRRRKLLAEGRIEQADRELPPYDYSRINGHPAWERRTILEWAAVNGKLDNAPWLYDEAKQWIPPGGPIRRVRRTYSEIEADRQRAQAIVDPDA